MVTIAFFSGRAFPQKALFEVAKKSWAKNRWLYFCAAKIPHVWGLSWQRRSADHLSAVSTVEAFFDQLTKMPDFKLDA